MDRWLVRKPSMPTDGPSEEPAVAPPDPAPDPTSPFAKVISMAWVCMGLTWSKNRYFSAVFSTEDILRGIAEQCNLFFCPSLLSVLTVAPPTLDFFKLTPTSLPDGFWAVYVIVLEKAGEVPLVYIGIGTSLYRGVIDRWKQYDLRDTLPKKMEEAMLRGYAIFHKRALVWCRRPAAALVPRARLLFKVLETVLTLILGAIHSSFKTIGMAESMPWREELKSAGFRGLCTHSPLCEPTRHVKKYLEMTDAEITLMFEQTKAHNREVKLARYADKKKNPGFMAEKRTKEATYLAGKDRNKRRHHAAISDFKRKKSRKYACGPCGHLFEGPKKLANHLLSKRHRLAVERAQRGKQMYRCKVCNRAYGMAHHLDRHLKGPVHANRAKVTAEVEAMEAAAAAAADAADDATASHGHATYSNESPQASAAVAYTLEAAHGSPSVTPTYPEPEVIPQVQLPPPCNEPQIEEPQSRQRRPGLRRNPSRSARAKAADATQDITMEAMSSPVKSEASSEENCTSSSAGNEEQYLLLPREDFSSKGWSAGNRFIFG